jgi:hypothetical protein
MITNGGCRTRPGLHFSSRWKDLYVMTQPGIEIVRDLITRFFNGHNPGPAAEFFTPAFRCHARPQCAAHW